MATGVLICLVGEEHQPGRKNEDWLFGKMPKQ